MPKNTLLNYFNKVKTPTSSGKASSASETPTKTDRKKSPVKSHSKPKKTASPKKNHGSPPKKKPDATVGERSDFNVGDLVWGRVEGHPWWPAIVTPNPTSKSHFRNGELHLQFFEEMPSRAWVKYRFVQAFTGSKSGPVASVPDPDWKKATLDANDALTMPVTQRLKLIRDFPPSDDEMEEELEEGKANNDSDQSKENVEVGDPKGKKRKKPSPKKGSVSRSPIAKRARRVMDSSDEDDGDIKMDEDSSDEFKPPADASDDSDSDASSGVPEHDASDKEASEVEESPRKKKKKSSTAAKAKIAASATPKNWLTPPVSSAKTPSSVVRKSSAAVTPSTLNKTNGSAASSTRKKLSMFAASDADDTILSVAEPSAGDEQWEHLKVDFLKPEHIKDADGRRPDDPDYNPRTLKVPKNYLDELTPGMRQWWEFKAKNFDVVLFFKVGKFYELYHMDAVLGVNELNLLFMRGKFAHSGFPEISYGRFADRLITKGYKVARIEQTETPEQNKERCTKMGRACTKWDKVVRRELCRVTTPATRLASFLDENIGGTQPKYLLAVSTKVCEGPGENLEVGVVFVDTSVGRFYVGQFADDRCCSRLRTLMAHYVPATVLLERGKVAPALSEILKNIIATKEMLTPDSEFMAARKTLKTLSEKKYFVPNGSKDGDPVYPEVLKELVEDADGLAMAPKTEKELCLRALGAVVWYLQGCLIDDDVISMGQFEEYTPVDWESAQAYESTLAETGGARVPAHVACGRHLVLDGITMKNLDLLVHSSTGSETGTLIEQIDHCVTAFGKRLVRDWLCRPLCNVDAINARLDAVDALRNRRDLVVAMREQLRTLPDFEKLLPRIHSEGSSRRNENHPDSRAVLFEMHKYSKRKIDGFLRVLDGFKTVVSIRKDLSDLSSSSSTLLSTLVRKPDAGGRFPDLEPLLNFFDEAFDHQEARKNGNIIPARAGVDAQYDAAKARLAENEAERENYLREQGRFFGVKVVYVGTGRNRFQLEVAEGASGKASGKHELSGQRKGFRRFVTDETKRFVSDEMKAEDAMEMALQDIGRSIMAKFDSHFKEWSTAVECLALVDVLMGFAVYADSLLHGSVRPEFVVPQGEDKPFLQVEEGRHPCLGPRAVPNSIRIGGTEAGFVLLTGPNMGGKSTFMRQAGLIAVLAQIGSFVPAEKCRLTPVDRIFTRIGASDSIMRGESTFYVELSETSAILKHASPYSLVLVDELGRGTATFDGAAIAASVVKAMSERGCLTVFSTHYHCLVEELTSCPRVALSHMACMVERDDEDAADGDDAADPTEETITFLYRNEPGPCPKSYGFNAARLAGLPDGIIRAGHARAVEFERLVSAEAQLVSVFGAAAAAGGFAEKFAELTCRG